MKQPLYLIMPRCQEQGKDARVQRVLSGILAAAPPAGVIEYAAELQPLRGVRLLFVVNLGSSGVNLEYYAMLKRLRQETQLFEDCLGALIVDGQSELYTKSVARELVFAANQAGCAFIGRPLVEGTGSLSNFSIRAAQGDSNQEEAYQTGCGKLLQRLLDGPPAPTTGPRELLVLHASSHQTSNTYALWQLVQQHLTGYQIQEIGLRNGSMVDCSGCPYTTCLHFGERGGCLYGGVMVEDVFPALERCQDLLLLCPNYNDALSANLTAFVNRLTALYRRQRFYDKRLYGLIVSGYSGGDILAGQLIAGLCMNKSFFLPPRFCLLETAHQAGSLLASPGIEERARVFAANLQRQG